MKTKNVVRSIIVSFSLSAIAFFVPTFAYAHCDTMNGPVVKGAQKALATNNVNIVLIWVQKKDEATIKEAFARTMAVRNLSPEAKALADMYFFETLVRIHRAGEGVAFTGLKPADTHIDPGIEAADKALEKGTAEELLKHLTEAVHHGVNERFTDALARKNFKNNDLEAGREYVKAYVTFIHFVERLYQAAKQPSGGHFHESESGANPDVH